VSNARFDVLAARALARRARQARALPRPPGELERAAAIRAMTAIARERVRRAWVGLGAVAAAAAIVAGLGLASLLRGGSPAPGAARPTVAESSPRAGAAAAPARGAGEVRLPGGAEVKRGQTLFARGRGDVVLSSATGTRLWLERAGELGVVEVGPAQRFKLARGHLRVEVAPLAAGERFVIETGDTEVEVHGTAFEVAVVPPDPRCRGGVTTRVDVSHGLVEIRSAGRDEHIGAAEHWPPECAAAPDAAPTTAADHARPGHPGHAATARARAQESPGKGESQPVEAADREAAPAAPAAAAPRAPLAAQNDLFQAALSKRDRGQTAQALAELDELLDRWPACPLAESAMAVRMRILQSTGNAGDARRAARDYLLRFPAGFARREAEALAGGGP
jgi:hypothetical protein